MRFKTLEKHEAAARVWDCPPYRTDQRQPAVAECGTLYPALRKVEQEGFIKSEWGISDNNRRAHFYSITRSGRAQLKKKLEIGSRRPRL
jgi:DNA-binding PadR family transcriptional regulator